MPAGSLWGQTPFEILKTREQRRAAGKSGRAALFEFASMIVIYSGRMPMITAKSMQRIENTHT